MESSSLPSEHARVLERVVEFFRGYPGVVGGSVSGSIARGIADEYSDVDVGIFFSDDESRERAWSNRWDWEIAPWLHRFDADHVKPYFVIYIYEPGVKTDLPLYVVGQPPEPGGAPYEVLWDDTAEVTAWVEASNAGRQEIAPDWTEAAHEDERLWAWAYYGLRHIQRGEYYDVATDFHMLRHIVEAWHARLGGKGFFDVRRVHEREPEVVIALSHLFPRPERGSLKRALLELIAIHERQRADVEARHGIEFRTSQESREKIRKWVEEL